MVYLINENYHRYYYANKCSLAWCFCILVYTAVILLPFFISFSINNFWLVQKYTAEQPDIEYRNEAIIYTYQEAASTTTLPVTAAYSTVSELNDRFSTQVVSPVIKAISYDNNNDGKADALEFDIRFVSDAVNLQKVQIFLFFNYKFSDIVKMTMIDFVVIDLSSTVGISGANVFGDLLFDQQGPISASPITRRLYNISYFNEATMSSNVFDMINEKIKRNETINLDYQSYVQPGGGSTTTTINIKLFVPPYQEIRYIPSLLETLKFSWIQYLSLFIPLYFIGNELLTFVFRNKVFNTQAYSSLPLGSKKFN